MADQITKPVAPDYTKYPTLKDWLIAYFKYWYDYMNYQNVYNPYRYAAYWYNTATINYFRAATGLTESEFNKLRDDAVKKYGILFPDADIINTMSERYRAGASLWKIYNELILPKQNAQNYIQYVDCFKAFRAEVIRDMENLNFPGAKSGYRLKYWDGCTTAFPDMQVTSKETGFRLIFWDFKNAKPFTDYHDNTFGEFFFEPLMRLTPNDEKIWKTEPNPQDKMRFRGKIGSANFSKSPIIKIGENYYWHSLGADEAFMYLLQYQLDALMTQPYNLWERLGGRDGDPVTGFVIAQATFDSNMNADKESERLGKIDWFIPPSMKTTLFEKIVSAAALGIAAVMTIATAGAATPVLGGILAALTKNAGQTFIDDKQQEQLNQLFSDQKQSLSDSLSEAEAQKAASGKKSNIIIIVIIAVIIIAVAYFVIKNKRK